MCIYRTGVKKQNYHPLRVLQNSNVYRLGDADTMIVSTVLDHVCTGDNVELIAADTDLLIMFKYTFGTV